MINKEIENINPFNDIYYKNCFYNSFFPIVYHFSKSIYNILANDVIRYENNKNSKTINIDYIECEDMLSMVNEIGIKVDTKMKSENVIDNIKTSLCKDKPVILWVDCYYESLRKDMYLKHHWGHTLLFYGFDDEKKEFNIIEHKMMENLSYKKMTISYDDVVKSYNSYLERFYHGTFPTYFEFYVDDLHNGLSVQEEINISLDKMRFNFQSKIEIIEKGLRELKECLEGYKKIAVIEDELSKHATELVNMTNNIINTKRVEEYRIQNFFGGESELFVANKQLIKYWENIRIVIAKYVYTSIYNEKSIEKSIEVCDLIINQEIKCFELMKELFSDI